MDRASHLTTVHALARQADAVMLDENSDWFLTMEGHDFELHDAVRPATCHRRRRATRPAARMSAATTAVGLRQGAEAVSGGNGEESPP